MTSTPRAFWAVPARTDWDQARPAGKVKRAHPRQRDLATGCDLDGNTPTIGAALAQKPATAQPLLNLGTDSGRVSLGRCRGTHVGDPDVGGLNSLDTRDFANEADRFVVELHVA